MPLLILIAQWALKIIGFVIILRLLSWVFNITNDHYTEGKKRTPATPKETRHPLRILRTLGIVLLIPTVLTFAVTYIARGDSVAALTLNEWAQIAAPFFKWTLILATFGGAILFIKSVFMSAHKDTYKDYHGEILPGSSGLEFEATIIGMWLMLGTFLLFLFVVFFQLPDSVQYAIKDLLGVAAPLEEYGEPVYGEDAPYLH